MSEPPKSNVEVKQESTERLEVLELTRTPRPEKLRRETEHLAGATEVAYQERAFRPRHPAPIDEVREKVDALVVERRTLPDLPPLPVVPPAPPRIRDAHRRALEPVVPGPLVAVEPVFATEAGEVVEAYYEEGGERRSRTYLIKDGAASPTDAVEARIDELPAPSHAPAPPPAPEAPPAAEEPKKRKLGFSLPKRKESKAAPPAEPEGEPKKKGRFGFGRK